MCYTYSESICFFFWVPRALSVVVHPTPKGARMDTSVFLFHKTDFSAKQLPVLPRFRKSVLAFCKDTSKQAQACRALILTCCAALFDSAALPSIPPQPLERCVALTFASALPKTYLQANRLIGCDVLARGGVHQRGGAQKT